MRSRLNPLEVQLPNPIHVPKDPRKLANHRLDLLLGEPQPGQPRNVQYLLPIDHVGDSRHLADLSPRRPAGHV